MHYSEYPPHPLLTDHIRFYWTIQSEFVTDKQPFITMGGLEFVINLADELSVENRQGCMLPIDQGLVIGPMINAGWVHINGPTHLLGITFKPGVAINELLNIKAQDVSSRFVEFTDLWHEPDQHIVHQCKDARNNINRQLSLLNHHFLKKLSELKNDPLISIALDTIEKQRGRTKVVQLAQQLGLSRCQFVRRFNDVVGLSPKQFCRLERMRYAFYQLMATPSINRAALALDCGYYDQAHFNRDFKDFTGLNPSEGRKCVSNLGKLLICPNTESVVDAA